MRKRNMQTKPKRNKTYLMKCRKYKAGGGRASKTSTFPAADELAAKTGSIINEREFCSHLTKLLIKDLKTLEAQKQTNNWTTC